MINRDLSTLPRTVRRLVLDDVLHYIRCVIEPNWIFVFGTEPIFHGDPNRVRCTLNKQSRRKRTKIRRDLLGQKIDARLMCFSTAQNPAYEFWSISSDSPNASYLHHERRSPISFDRLVQEYRWWWEHLNRTLKSSGEAPVDVQIPVACVFTTFSSSVPLKVTLSLALSIWWSCRIFSRNASTSKLGTFERACCDSICRNAFVSSLKRGSLSNVEKHEVSAIVSGLEKANLTC